jgi:hypothetical protein
MISHLTYQKLETGFPETEKRIITIQTARV